ncbi:MAG: pentapeptide repeat-containing protein, partial [Nitrospinota bacterium]|nr:pentapeptide repeat-containing protein [Nitrospinota bacterium]
LQGADFRRAELQGVNLYKANLQGADLYLANLQGADLSEAYLQGADLSEANLQGAELNNADLQGVDLRWANLQGAELKNAQLRGAVIFNTNLSGILTDDKTILEGAFVFDSMFHTPEKPFNWEEETENMRKSIPENRRSRFDKNMKKGKKRYERAMSKKSGVKVEFADDMSEERKKEWEELLTKGMNSKYDKTFTEARFEAACINKEAGEMIMKTYLKAQEALKEITTIAKKQKPSEEEQSNIALVERFIHLHEGIEAHMKENCRKIYDSLVAGKLITPEAIPPAKPSSTAPSPR